MTEPLLGRVLVDSGYISSEQLNKAIEMQHTMGLRLGQILLEMGALDDETLALALGQQTGFPMVDPLATRVEPDLLAQVPKEKAIELNALPLVHAGPQLVCVAMANPFDLDARRDMEFLLGAAIDPVVCKAGQLREAIKRHYGLERELEAMLESVKPSEDVEVSTLMDIDLETIEERLRRGGAKPYIDLLNFLLANAHGSRASDIHIDPGDDHLQVRYRIDGVLRSAIKLPKWVEAGLISRIKVVAEMDLSIHHKPQEGRVRASIGGREKDLRVAMIPSQHGPRTVIRILDPAILDLALSDLGFAPEQLKTYYRMISQPQGIILVTGPTGSGKSTTLYATLNRLRSEQTSIVSVEDPVEYTLPGISQVQVDEKRGMTFPVVARSLLRQDPNVLVIGEIRDRETAAVAFQAALTGHLVFTTVHTGDTVSTISRLRELGVPLYLVGSTLLGIVAQRLVRRLCPYCRQEGEPEAEAWEPLEIAPYPMPNAYTAGQGCRDCIYTGFRGRMGVYELLRIDDSLRNLLVSGGDESALRRAARDKGLVTLVEQGLGKVESGITSLGEVVRHVRSPFAPKPERRRELIDEVPEIDDEHVAEAVTADFVAEDVFRKRDRAETRAAEAAKEDSVAPWAEIELSQQESDPIHIDDVTVPPARPSGEPDHILAVDDADEILDLVRYSLEGAGFRVMTAHDGEEALVVIERQKVNDPIHLVVLDVMMPGISGFEVCEQLKKDISTAFLPVLILSARGDSAHIKSGFRSGADDYLPKPFDPEELELRIRALLRRAYGGARMSQEG